MWKLRVSGQNQLIIGRVETKKLLFEKVFDTSLGTNFFKGRSVIGLGCNAGGATVEILKRGAASVKAVEGNEVSFRQLQLVLSSDVLYKTRAQPLRYTIGKQSHAQLQKDLGSSDIGICLGLIYHLNKNDVINVLKFLFDATKT